MLSFRLGGLHARYADSIEGDAGALGARLTWTTPLVHAVVDGSWAQFTTGTGAGQGWGSLTLLGSASARHAVGMRFEAVGNAAQGNTWAGNGSAELFAALAAGPWTLSTGLVASAIRTTAARGRAAAGFSARARRDLDRRLSLSVSADGIVADTLRYADWGLGAAWQRGESSLGVSLGMRSGDLATRATWAQAWGSVALNPRLAIEVSAGTYPGDLTGFLHGAFFNAGVRVQLWRRPVAGVYPAAYAAPTAAAPANTHIEVQAVDAVSTRVSFTVGNAGSVAIAGAWNDWQPVPLARDAGGRWTGVIPVGRGTHRFALVVDERWTVPPGITRLPDDFGGEVGLLIVR